MMLKRIKLFLFIKLQTYRILQSLHVCDSSKFLIHNANNLVSLTLCHVNLPSEVAKLPQLRGLNIFKNCSVSYYPIFSKCKESLKCLVSNESSLGDFDVAMPLLIDLYVASNMKDYVTFNIFFLTIRV